MRYVSQLFQPLITIPKNAKIKNTEITCKSQKLLLECGLVRPTSSGLFSLLPLAQRALDKLEALVRTHIEATGAQRVSLPALAAEYLWEKSGRLQAAGPELMRTSDRHQKRYLLAPTHEESIADLLSDVGPLTYKQLPLLLYQIGPKYRDESRPKHGLLRAREFRMMDAYAAHATQHCASETYATLSLAYTHLFHALELPVHRVEAPTGDMGGSTSHEWQLRAPAGEDAIDVCLTCSHAALASDEGQRCSKCGNVTERSNSIEVGHTFVLGSRYSEPLGALYSPAQGPADPLLMSCYGIGLTRLLAASVEALCSEVSLRWPRAIAPYSAIVLGPKAGSKEWQPQGWEGVLRVAQRVDAALGGGGAGGAGGDVLVDDRHHLTIGKRLLMADKMGYPYIIVCGRHTLESPPRYELRGGGDTQLYTEEQLVQALADNNKPSLHNNTLENVYLLMFHLYFYLLSYHNIHIITSKVRSY